MFIFNKLESTSCSGLMMCEMADVGSIIRLLICCDCGSLGTRLYTNWAQGWMRLFENKTENASYKIVWEIQRFLENASSFILIFMPNIVICWIRWLASKLNRRVLTGCLVVGRSAQLTDKSTNQLYTAV